MINVLKDFRVITVAREKRMLVLLNATATGRLTPLGNVNNC